MSAISDFFSNLFGKFLDFITGLMTDLLTQSARILVNELQEGAPMAIQWARDAVEAAEQAGGDGQSKWDAAFNAFTSKAKSEGYEWSTRAIDTLLQNTVNVVKAEALEFISGNDQPKAE
jgi:hypothetical protein